MLSENGSREIQSPQGTASDAELSELQIRRALTVAKVWRRYLRLLFGLDEYSGFNNKVVERTYHFAVANFDSKMFTKEFKNHTHNRTLDFAFLLRHAENAGLCKLNGQKMNV